MKIYFNKNYYYNTVSHVIKSEDDIINTDDILIGKQIYFTDIYEKLPYIALKNVFDDRLFKYVQPDFFHFNYNNIDFDFIKVLNLAYYKAADLTVVNLEFYQKTNGQFYAYILDGDNKIDINGSLSNCIEIIKTKLESDTYTTKNKNIIFDMFNFAIENNIINDYFSDSTGYYSEYFN